MRHFAPNSPDDDGNDFEIFEPELGLECPACGCNDIDVLRMPPLPVEPLRIGEEPPPGRPKRIAEWFREQGNNTPHAVCNHCGYEIWLRLEELFDEDDWRHRRR